MIPIYKTEIRIQVHPWKDSTPVIVATVKRGEIVVEAPAIERGGYRYAEDIARATLAAIQRARSIHRRVFGRRMP